MEAHHSHFASHFRFLGINDVTGILKQKFLVRVRSQFFGRHGHSFLPIWLKFGMKVA